MNSRTYYGEYSLEHWIKLMCTKNIGLPQYQRSFVWDEKDVKRLISSMKDGQFVQPVTIALNCNSDDSGYKNLILDGQQRLSAILLAYYGVFPILSPSTDDNYMHEEEQDGEQIANSTKKSNWTFSDLIHKISTTTGTLNSKDICTQFGNYHLSDYKVDSNFFKKTYLGFSYIVPNEKKRENIQQGFTKLFRNINYFGKSLSCIESRRSLYYTQKELLNYFEGLDENGSDVLCEIGIYEQMQSRKIDFLRYISILSEFFSLKNNKENYEEEMIMKGYSSYSSRETYYADYVSYILGLDEEVNDDKFSGFNFNKIFPKSTREERFSRLRETILKLKHKMNLRKDNSFPSWIDADYWLFGLVYHIVFMGKELRNKISDIDFVIETEIKKVRNNGLYTKSPNRLTHLRKRISESIKLIANYVN